MLMEELNLAGYTPIGSNTDAAMYRTPNDNIDLQQAAKIIDNFSKLVNIPLEPVFYKKMIFSNVNTYLWVDKYDSIKLKGSSFIDDPSKNLAKGFDKPVIAKAIINYLLDGTSPEESIRNEKNIYMFTMSKKSAKKFTVVYKELKNGKLKESVLQKTNRYIISNSGGSLIKLNKETGKEIVFSNAKTCIVLNTITDNNAENYDINKGFYIKEAWKIINKINNNFQISLF